MSGALHRLDVLADRARLLLIVPNTSDDHLGAEVIVRVQRLAEPALIVCDEPGRRTKDVPGGAIIALQPDHLRARKVLFEPKNVLHLGAAPAVDRLVVVSDAAQVGRCRALGQQPQPEILSDIGVLVLVHQHEAEAALIVGQYVRVLPKQPEPSSSKSPKSTALSSFRRFW